MFRYSVAAAAALALAATAAFAAEDAGQGATSAKQIDLAQGIGRQFCLSCKGEKPANGRYTCWDASGLEFPVRLRGDLICATNFGNPIYQIGEGACSTKKYCKTIK